jgi:hypothetical protein
VRRALIAGPQWPMFRAAHTLDPSRMEILPPIASFALPATLLLLLTLLGMRLRQRRSGKRGGAREAVDTVAGWPPEVVRVLTITERQAYDLLRRAMPGFLVLAQVPLSRFIRVPPRRSYGDWLQRVGSLSADLLLCDSGSRVLAVIDIRPAQESARSKQRHARMARVLRGAGVHVHVWHEGELPSPSDARNALASVLGPAAAGFKPTPSRPMPLIPVADIHEILAQGDRVAHETAQDASGDPVPSAFFDEAESALPAR